MFLLAAISLGFLGSFHCIGMCGPIALAIPVKRTSPLSVFTGSLIYNSGRIITYALLGVIFGLLGHGFVLAGWQNVLSVSLGVMILVLLFIPKSSLLKPDFRLLYKFVENVKSKIRKLFGIHNQCSLLLIGLLNGLLPCGLVYLGVAGSIATGDPLKGALFMAAFGLGTFPAMMAVTIAREHISISFRERVRKAVPVFVGMMAIMLILRGMNLGIPYLSPGIEKNNGPVHIQCCKK